MCYLSYSNRKGLLLRPEQSSQSQFPEEVVLNILDLTSLL